MLFEFDSLLNSGVRAVNNSLISIERFFFFSRKFQKFRPTAKSGLHALARLFIHSTPAGNLSNRANIQIGATQWLDTPSENTPTPLSATTLTALPNNWTLLPEFHSFFFSRFLTFFQKMYFKWRMIQSFFDGIAASKEWGCSPRMCQQRDQISLLTITGTCDEAKGLQFLHSIQNDLRWIWYHYWRWLHEYEGDQ